VTDDRAGRRGRADDEVLERLGEVDPAVVRSVERALGCRLFEDGPAGVSVTEIGARVLPYARVLLAVARAMVDEVARAEGLEGER
jgi:DNA-binding transcriptional LysR family regulator